MHFAAPEWFFLIPALIVVGLMWRVLRLEKPLRLLSLLGIIALLAEPKISRKKNALDLWVLLDRSESTEDLIDQGLPEWKRLLESSKQAEDERLRLINYASEAIEQGAGETSTYQGRRQLTRTQLALDTALTLSEKEQPSRILLFSDGYATEPLSEVATRLKEKGIPLDYRLLREEIANDFRIARVQMPERAQIAEPFIIKITVVGHADGTVPLELWREGKKLTESSVTLTKGTGKIEFTDRLDRKSVV